MSINEIKKDEKVLKTTAEKVSAKVEAPKAEPAKKEITVKKAAPAKKTAAKKAAPAKKTATTKKAVTKAAKTVVANANVYVEFAGNQFAAKDIRTKCEADFKKSNKGIAIKTLDIYVKPEENVAYYVVNGNADGLKVEL